MKCPLQVFHRLDLGLIHVDRIGECVREKCAWYHPTTLSCEVSRIASNLSGINNALAHIAENMPHNKWPEK